MKITLKNIRMIGCFFLIIMALFFANNISVKAEGENFYFGKFDFKTQKFVDAYGTGTELYKSILIANGNAEGSSIELELPTVDGFIKSADASTNYSTVINMPSGKTPEEIGNYIKEIIFKNCSDGQMIQIVISDKIINNKTFYYAANQHYYQYVGYTDIGKNHSWVDAYNLAKQLTYGGRQGYLATVTSFEEDLFIYNASNSIGWLGGTVLTHGDEEGSLYYSSFNKNSGANTWYWADGPERGQVFFEGKGSGVYKKNEEKGYYFNWANNEPNKSIYSKESCLTSLRTGVGYAAKKAGINIKSSWNDAPENSQSVHSVYGVKGYFVEYGDQIIGDSGANSGDSIISSVVITYPTVKQKEEEILVYDGTEKKPTIIVEFDNNTLIEGKDYEIQYVGVNPIEYGPSTTAPKEVGTYKAVLIFKDNYEGIQKEVVFSIINSGLVIITDSATPNAHNAKLMLNSEELLNKLKLTDSELEALHDNKKIYIYLEVNDITDIVSEADRDIIEKSIETNVNIGRYLDVNLFKKVDEEESVKITELNKPINISFTIPDELLNINSKINRTFEVYVLHDNLVTKTNVEINDNTGTFEADRFSTYVLTYTDTKIISNPQTGDNVLFYISMLGLSLLGLTGTILYFKKKRFN